MNEFNNDGYGGEDRAVDDEQWEKIKKNCAYITTRKAPPKIEIIRMHQIAPDPGARVSIRAFIDVRATGGGICGECLIKGVQIVLDKRRGVFLASFPGAVEAMRGALADRIASAALDHFYREVLQQPRPVAADQ